MKICFLKCKIARRLRNDFVLHTLFCLKRNFFLFFENSKIFTPRPRQTNTGAVVSVTLHGGRSGWVALASLTAVRLRRVAPEIVLAFGAGSSWNYYYFSKFLI